MSWGPLHADDGVARYFVAAAFWLLVVAALWPRGDTAIARGAAPAAEPPRAAVPASEPTPPPAPEVEVEPTTEVVATEPAEPGDSKIASDAAELAADDEPPPDARQRAMRLDAIDVRWTGEGMAVVIRGGDGGLVHALRFDSNVQGYVLDLPGRWTLPNTLRLVRTFERSNLLRLRVGRHDDFLRVVFSLRNPAGAEPLVEQRDGELALLFR